MGSCTLLTDSPSTWPCPSSCSASPSPSPPWSRQSHNLGMDMLQVIFIGELRVFTDIMDTMDIMTMVAMVKGLLILAMAMGMLLAMITEFRDFMATMAVVRGLPCQAMVGTMAKLMSMKIVSMV